MMSIMGTQALIQSVTLHLRALTSPLPPAPLPCPALDSTAAGEGHPGRPELPGLALHLQPGSGEQAEAACSDLEWSTGLRWCCRRWAAAAPLPAAARRPRPRPRPPCLYCLYRPAPADGRHGQGGAGAQPVPPGQLDSQARHRPHQAPRAPLLRAAAPGSGAAQLERLLVRHPPQPLKKSSSSSSS